MIAVPLAASDALQAVAIVVSMVSALMATGALLTSRKGLALQRLSVGISGRQLAAADIARWAAKADELIERIHNPENWRVPEGVEYGAETGIKAGDIVPPSQARIGPVIAREVDKLEPIQQLSTLAFGPGHEVTTRVDDVVQSIRQIAERGVIYGDPIETQTPYEYVTDVFRPQIVDLYDALEAACDFQVSRPDVAEE